MQSRHSLPWLTEADVQATDVQATDVQATDVQATDVKATDLKAIDAFPALSAIINSDWGGGSVMSPAIEPICGSVRAGR